MKQYNLKFEIGQKVIIVKDNSNVFGNVYEIIESNVDSYSIKNNGISIIETEGGEYPIEMVFATIEEATDEIIKSYNKK